MSSSSSSLSLLSSLSSFLPPPYNSLFNSISPWCCDYLSHANFHDDSKNIRMDFIGKYFITFAILYVLSVVTIYVIGKIFLSPYPSPSPSSSSFYFSPTRTPPLLSSRVLSYFHSFFVLYFSVSHWMSQWENRNYVGPNTPMSIRIMEWSLAYFVTDTIHFVLFEINDWMLLAHHSISISFFLMVLQCGHGGHSAMLALVSGEITNPLQSTFFIVKHFKWRSAMRIVSPIFTATFLLFRVVLLPIWIVDLLAQYYSHYQSPISPIPFSYPLTWGIMSILMTLGGFVWSYKLFMGCVKQFTNSNPNKDKVREKEQ